MLLNGLHVRKDGNCINISDEESEPYDHRKQSVLKNGMALHKDKSREEEWITMEGYEPVERRYFYIGYSLKNGEYRDMDSLPEFILPSRKYDKSDYSLYEKLDIAASAALTAKETGTDTYYYRNAFEKGNYLLKRVEAVVKAIEEQHKEHEQQQTEEDSIEHLSPEEVERKLTAITERNAQISKEIDELNRARLREETKRNKALEAELSKLKKGNYTI